MDSKTLPEIGGADHALAQQLVRKMRDLKAWRKEVRSDYREKGGPAEQSFDNFSDTNLGRNRGLLRAYLSQYVFPALKSHSESAKAAPVDILEVGTGGGDESVSEPWELLALFMQAGFSPSVHVVEYKRENIRSFNRANALHSSRKWATNSPEADYAYAVQIAQILGGDVTGTASRFSVALPQGLKSSFHLTQGDVVLWDPRQRDLGRFSLAVMLNVAKYIKNPAAIAVAFLSILSAIKEGGFVLISSNDRKALFLESPIMQEALGYSVVTAYTHLFDVANAALMQKAVRA
ncbi:MAG: hypothetical protein NT099_10105 [Candidatus Saganbacteria bacterium]|nr:hypothetical protein [Candidatus Saganbacteria bacterium]